MIVIDRMENDLRLAGRPHERARLARRLDRIVEERIADVVAAALGELDRPGGPVFLIRRLDLRLWIDAARTADGDIARTWGTTLARALYRQVAHAGPAEVRRFDSQAAFLAAWLSDHVAGRVAGRWEYAEFSTLDDVPSGRAAAHVLAGDRAWIAPTLQFLAATRRLDALVAAFASADVAVLWRGWTGGPAAAPDRIEPALVARATGLVPDPPAPETGGADARARTALRWLVALTTGPGALPPEVAGGLAMQLGHLTALLAAAPGLRVALAAGAPPDPTTHRAIATSAGQAAAAWIHAALELPGGPARLAALVAVAEPRTRSPRRSTATATARRSERIASGFAGLALLLPAIRASGLAERLGASGLQRLLVVAIPPPRRALAAGDPALRWLSGLPSEAPVRAEGIDWPGSTGLEPHHLAADAQSHGDGPELPALRAVLDGFAAGLRGMDGASAGYLTAQFLARPGRLERDDDRLAVRLDGVPLRILLRIGGRLGTQGPVEWLGGRELVIEAPDG